MKGADSNMRLGKLLKFTVLAILVIAIGVVGAVVGILMFGGPPMQDGAKFADGKVTLVIERMGPVRIGAYVIDLDGGGFALVDAGMDPGGKAVLSALSSRGARASDVVAVFVTHAHGDHSGGVRAFPNAQVFAMEPDAAALRRGGVATRGLADGERVTVNGTVIEAFAVPGHTPGSAAYLVQGVLFLGDAAAAISESAVAPNDFAYTANTEQNHRSLRALVERLGSRRDQVRFLAFGHQGPVTGLAPLVDWASQ